MDSDAWYIIYCDRGPSGSELANNMNSLGRSRRRVARRTNSDRSKKAKLGQELGSMEESEDGLALIKAKRASTAEDQVSRNFLNFSSPS